MDRHDGTVTSAPAPVLDRSDLLDDAALQGTAFAEAHTERLDDWVRAVAESLGVPDGVALVAVGGYGRREMAPHSDLDLVLVHTPEAEHQDFAERVWYPMWDSGLKLGQRVDTIDGLCKLARTDLDTATALLSVRHLVGDESLALDLAVAAASQWREAAADNAMALSERLSGMHDANGEVAFLLHPDLKNGRGGLRDTNALVWARATGVLGQDPDLETIADDREVILRARIALHRVTSRATDRLALDFQDDVAAALGYSTADELMADISAAARAIAWASDGAWFWVDRSLRDPVSAPQALDGGIVLDGGLLRITDDADLSDPELPFQVALVAARHRAFIERRTLRLLPETPAPPTPWTDSMRSAFAELLGYGRPAIAVIEAFDRVGLMSRMIPEWEPCRSRPQRNDYHRFTVDRHLLEAAAEASSIVDRVARPDLLVVGALLHDIGKGYPGDHTDVGVELIAAIAARMGYPPADVETLVDMCRHHLLLPDVATRRDLDDDGTIRTVADAVRSVDFLVLLAALTEADSVATGPAAWNRSKADLVNLLVQRVDDVLSGADPQAVVGRRFPGPKQRALMNGGVFAADIDERTVTVVQRDRAGAFSRVAGVLTLNGLDIVRAAAHTEDGMALSEFTVHTNEFDAGRLIEQLELGTKGRLALDARVDDRRATYARSMKRQSAKRIVPSVTVDNATSHVATVVEVTGRDQIGLLYRIARALAELKIGISTARIQTIGDEVIDAFYVTADGNKLEDPAHLAEVERAILHAMARK